MIKQNTTRGNATWAAFLLAEERACAGYLEARKAMAASARRLDSLNQLVAERPNRLDYRRARDKEMSAYGAAVERTRLAWNSWQRAQLRYDAAWAATEGRHRPGLDELQLERQARRARKADTARLLKTRVSAEGAAA